MPTTDKKINSFYKLSKDYDLLYQHICQGHIIAAFVDYNFVGSTTPPSRDICKIRRFKEYDIQFGSRGIGYGDVTDYFKGTHSELNLFLSECSRMNLEWINTKN